MKSIEMLYNDNTVIVAWGCGDMFRKKKNYLHRLDYIVDCDQKKIGKTIDTMVIHNPNVILNKKQDDILIIIFPEEWGSIVNEIHNYGISAKYIHIDMVIANKKKTSISSFALFAEDGVIQGLSNRYDFEIKHYLDIGGNHPVYGNATYSFYLLGAVGCVVEPNNMFASDYKKLRPKDILLDYGVTNSKESGASISYYRVKGLETRNSFLKNDAIFYRSKGFDIVEEKKKMISLNDILEMIKIPIDYVSIDVEGLEYSIIQDFDFSSNNITVFNIEKGEVKIIDVMKKNGYELISETRSNWIFLKKGIAVEKI